MADAFELLYPYQGIPVGDFNTFRLLLNLSYLPVKFDEHDFSRMGVRPACLAGTYKLSLVDIEHTLCEVHKYARALGGGYVTRARFMPNAKPLPVTPVLPRAWADPARRVVRIRPGGTRERAQKQYIVAQLLGKRNAEDPEDKEEYLVDWLGCGEKDRSWEPAWMLEEEAPDMVKKFEASRKERKRRRS